MPSIIADSRVLFSLRCLARRLLHQIATDCPLCEGDATGGALCAGCAQDMTQSMCSGGARCARCAQRLTAEGHACAACLTMQPVFSRAIAAFDYEPPFDSLIGRYKAEHRFGLSTTLASLLARAVERVGGVQLVGPQDRGGGAGLARQPPAGSGVLTPGTILVPIPSSQASLRRRGFNPAAELAASLGACLQLPVRRGLLRRLREGPRQTLRNRAARQRAAAGLFDCAQSLRGLSVALVDDVMTTGSTVNAAAQALLDAGAAEVIVLVAARTPVRDQTDERRGRIVDARKNNAAVPGKIASSRAACADAPG